MRQHGIGKLIQLDRTPQANALIHNVARSHNEVPRQRALNIERGNLLVGAGLLAEIARDSLPEVDAKRAVANVVSCHGCRVISIWSRRSLIGTGEERISQGVVAG